LCAFAKRFAKVSVHSFTRRRSVTGLRGSTAFPAILAKSKAFNTTDYNNMLDPVYAGASTTMFIAVTMAQPKR